MKITTKAWHWALLSGGMFVFLTALMKLGLLKDVDQYVLLSMRQSTNFAEPAGPVWFQESVKEITVLGSYTVLVILSVIMLVALIVLREHKKAIYLFSALIIGSAISSSLKLALSRPRPDLVPQLDVVFTNSYPSAHAMVSMFAWLLFALLLSSLAKTARLINPLIICALLVSLMVGVSRIYLGVHWPSDVVAGWAAGVCWTCICATIWQRC